MVDASAWIALFHRADSHRDEAERIFAKLGPRPLVTTTPFALEAHKRLRHDRRAGPGAAGEFASLLRDGRLARVVEPGSLVPFRAVLDEWLRRRDDLSLEDLSGTLTMRALGIRDIWAWDEDFRRLGFRVLP